jgi:hypothetical protein
LDLADFLAAEFLATDFLGVGLRWEVGLRRAGVEREVILFGPVVAFQLPSEGGTSTFKRALIGIGESAPIRDR